MRINLVIDTVHEALQEQDEESPNDGIPLSLLSGFYQIHIELVDLALQESEDEQPTNFEVNSYGISNAPQSYIDALTEIEQFNEPGQFNELNTQYFEDNSYDIVPFYLYQEL